MVEDQKQKFPEGGATPAACHRFSTRVVENVLYEHEGLDEVAVFYVTDNDGVDKLVAFIVLRNPELTETEIMDFLVQSGQLDSKSLPQIIKIVPKIPKSPSGKVLRLRLLDGLGPEEE